MNRGFSLATLRGWGQKIVAPIDGPLMLIAGLLDTAWAVSLKFSHGFTRLWPSLFTILCMVVSMALIALALKTLPMGSVYAMWTGIGAVGTVLFGILIFGEPATLIRLSCIGLIIVGMVGLKFAS